MAALAALAGLALEAGPSPAATVCSVSELGCPALPATCVITASRDVGHLCSLDFGNQSVEIRGTLQAEQVSGSFDLRAANVTLHGGRLRSPGDSDQPGGDIRIVADGAFLMTGTSAQIDTGGNGGGGFIDVEARSIAILSGNVLADGGTGADCGDAGSVSLVATDGPLVLDGNAVTVKASTGGYLCSGADVYLEGTSVDLRRGVDASGGAPAEIGVHASSGDIVLSASAGLSADGRGTFEDQGNAAGAITLSAEAGDISLHGPLSAIGSGPDGAGGDVTVVAFDGAIVVGQPIDVKAPGSDSDAGSIVLDAGESVTVGARLTAAAGGQSSGGGIDVASFGPIILMAGFLSSVDGGGRDAGSIDVTSDSLVTIAGALSAQGSNGGDGGAIDVRGCEVLVGGAVDAGASSTGIAGEIFVEGASIELGADANLDATPCADDACTQLRLRDGAPVIAATADVDPPAIVLHDPSFRRCCGNGVVDDGTGNTPDAGELCDDDNRRHCDGCSPSCTPEPSPACPDDHDECTQDCHPLEGCGPFPLSGTSCTADASACTADVCQAGACTHPPLVCQDGVACTANGCDPATGCVFSPNDSACDDEETCTTERCDLVAGCVYTSEPDGTSCDDGSLCTSSDACAGGVCTGPAPSCDDGNACTRDGCRASLGCTNLEDSAACGCTDDAGEPLPAGAPCADGNTCTVGDACDPAGVCRPGESCPDDGSACTIELCFLGMCGRVDLGCPGDGACSDGQPCSDGDTCTSGVCAGGSCVSQPISCGDGDACSGEEICVANVGCHQASFPSPNDPACPGTLDAFTCYGSKTSRAASATFDPVLGLSLEDELGRLDVDVKRARSICLPTDAGGGSPGAAAHEDHLEAYQLKLAAGSPKFAKVSGLRIENQLGTVTVDAKKPKYVLVPTALGDGEPAEPLAPPDPDHFLCYQVAISKGTAKFTPISGLALEDAFGALVVDVKKPTLLCNPASKGGEDPSAPGHVEHLLCYQAVTTRGSARFQPRSELFLANSFGDEQVDVKKLQEICLPSLVTPAP